MDLIGLFVTVLIMVLLATAGAVGGSIGRHFYGTPGQIVGILVGLMLLPMAIGVFVKLKSRPPDK
jgi:hypothetical protein